MSQNEGRHVFKFERVSVPGGPSATERLRGFAMATRTDPAVTTDSRPGNLQSSDLPRSPGRDMWVKSVGVSPQSRNGSRRGSAHPMPQAPMSWGDALRNGPAGAAARGSSPRATSPSSSPARTQSKQPPKAPLMRSSLTSSLVARAEAAGAESKEQLASLRASITGPQSGSSESSNGVPYSQGGKGSHVAGLAQVASSPRAALRSRLGEAAGSAGGGNGRAGSGLGGATSFLAAAEQRAIREGQPRSIAGVGSGQPAPQATQGSEARSLSPSRGPRRPSGPMPAAAAKASQQLQRSRSQGRGGGAWAATLAGSPLSGGSPLGASGKDLPIPSPTAAGTYAAVAAATASNGGAPPPPTPPPGTGTGSPAGTGTPRTSLRPRERRTAQFLSQGQSQPIGGGPAQGQAGTATSPATAAAAPSPAVRKKLSTLPHLSKNFTSSFTPSPSAASPPSSKGVQPGTHGPNETQRAAEASSNPVTPPKLPSDGTDPQGRSAVSLAAWGRYQAERRQQQAGDDADRPPSLDTYLSELRGELNPENPDDPVTGLRFGRSELGGSPRRIRQAAAIATQGAHEASRLARLAQRHRKATSEMDRADEGSGDAEYRDSSLTGDDVELTTRHGQLPDHRMLHPSPGHKHAPSDGMDSDEDENRGPRSGQHSVSYDDDVDRALPGEVVQSAAARRVAAREAERGVSAALARGPRSESVIAPSKVPPPPPGAPPAPTRGGNQQSSRADATPRDEDAEAASDAAAAAEEAAAVLHDLAADWGVDYDARLAVGARSQQAAQPDSVKSPPPPPPLGGSVEGNQFAIQSPSQETKGRGDGANSPTELFASLAVRGRQQQDSRIEDSRDDAPSSIRATDGAPTALRQAGSSGSPVLLSLRSPVVREAIYRAEYVARDAVTRSRRGSLSDAPPQDRGSVAGTASVTGSQASSSRRGSLGGAAPAMQEVSGRGGSAGGLQSAVGLDDQVAERGPEVNVNPEPPAGDDDGTDLVVTLSGGRVVPFSDVVRRGLTMSDGAAEASARLAPVERSEMLRSAVAMLSEPALGSWLRLYRDLSASQRGDTEDLSDATAAAATENAKDAVARAAALPAAILTRYVEAASVSSARAQARLSALQSAPPLHHLATRLLSAGIRENKSNSESLRPWNAVLAMELGPDAGQRSAGAPTDSQSPGAAAAKSDDASASADIRPPSPQSAARVVELQAMAALSSSGLDPPGAAASQTAGASRSPSGAPAGKQGVRMPPGIPPRLLATYVDSLARISLAWRRERRRLASEWREKQAPQEELRNRLAAARAQRDASQERSRRLAVRLQEMSREVENRRQRITRDVTELEADEIQDLLDGSPVSEEDEATIRAELDAAATRLGEARAAMTIEEATRQLRMRYTERVKAIQTEGEEFRQRLAAETRQLMKGRVDEYVKALESNIEEKRRRLERKRERMLHQVPLRALKREVRQLWGLQSDGSSTLASTFSGRRPTGADLAKRLAAGGQVPASALGKASPASEKRAGKYLRLFLASSLRHAGYSGKLFEHLRSAAVHFPLSLRLRLSVFKGEATRRPGGGERGARMDGIEGSNGGKAGGAGALLQRGERSRDIDGILQQAMRKAKREASGSESQKREQLSMEGTADATTSSSPSAYGGRQHHSPPLSDEQSMARPRSPSNASSELPEPRASLLAAPTPRTKAAESIEKELERAKLRHAGMRAALAAAATAEEEATAIEASERGALSYANRFLSAPPRYAPPSPESTVLKSPDLDPISPLSATAEALIRGQGQVLSAGAAQQLRHAASRMSDGDDSVPEGVNASAPSDVLLRALQRAGAPRPAGSTSQAKQIGQENTDPRDSRESRATGLESPFEKVHGSADASTPSPRRSGTEAPATEVDSSEATPSPARQQAPVQTDGGEPSRHRLPPSLLGGASEPRAPAVAQRADRHAAILRGRELVARYRQQAAGLGEDFTEPGGMDVEDAGEASVDLGGTPSGQQKLAGGIELGSSGPVRGLSQELPRAWAAALSPAMVANPDTAAEDSAVELPQDSSPIRNGTDGLERHSRDASTPSPHGTDTTPLATSVPESEGSHQSDRGLDGGDAFDNGSSEDAASSRQSEKEDRPHAAMPSEQPAGSTEDEAGSDLPPRQQPKPAPSGRPQAQPKLGFGSSAPRGLAERDDVASRANGEQGATAAGGVDESRRSQPAGRARARKGRRLPPSLSKWKSRQEQEAAAAAVFAPDTAETTPADEGAGGGGVGVIPEQSAVSGVMLDGGESIGDEDGGVKAGAITDARSQPPPPVRVASSASRQQQPLAASERQVRFGAVDVQSISPIAESPTSSDVDEAEGSSVQEQQQGAGSPAGGAGDSQEQPQAKRGRDAPADASRGIAADSGLPPGIGIERGARIGGTSRPQGVETIGDSSGGFGSTRASAQHAPVAAGRKRRARGSRRMRLPPSLRG